MPLPQGPVQIRSDSAGLNANGLIVGSAKGRAPIPIFVRPAMPVLLEMQSTLVCSMLKGGGKTDDLSCWYRSSMKLGNSQQREEESQRMLHVLQTVASKII